MRLAEPTINVSRVWAKGKLVRNFLCPKSRDGRLSRLLIEVAELLAVLVRRGRWHLRPTSGLGRVRGGGIGFGASSGGLEIILFRQNKVVSTSPVSPPSLFQLNNKTNGRTEGGTVSIAPV